MFSVALEGVINWRWPQPFRKVKKVGSNCFEDDVSHENEREGRGWVGLQEKDGKGGKTLLEQTKGNFVTDLAVEKVWNATGMDGEEWWSSNISSTAKCHGVEEYH